MLAVLLALLVEIVGLLLLKLIVGVEPVSVTSLLNDQDVAISGPPAPAPSVTQFVPSLYNVIVVPVDSV